MQVSINAFQELISAVDKWFVFSEQIDKILLLNGVKQDNIFALRHGVDNVFSDNFPGISKMNKSIVKEGILGVLQLRWFSLISNYRKRVKNSHKVNQSAKASNQKEILVESKS